MANLKKFLCNKIKIMNREIFEQYDYKNLKCCTKTPCMTTKTLSLMGNSLGHPLLDIRVVVVWLTLSTHSIVKCKRQTVKVKRQAI